MHIQGFTFPPNSSKRCSAALEVSLDSQQITLIFDDQSIQSHLQEVKVSPLLIGTPIQFRFSDGRLFVAEYSSDLDLWLSSHIKPSLSSKIESSKHLLTISIVASLAILALGFFYFLPWASYQVAHHLIPDEVSEHVAIYTIETLDHALEPSQISAEKQKEIRERVYWLSSKVADQPFPTTVHFRSLNDEANAFALPGGHIVLLDGLINLAENEQQLNAIILHEMGHIHHRHMMSHLVHSGFISITIALVTGEGSGVLDQLTGIASFSLNNLLSREDEREADLYASQAMINIYGSNDAMIKMLSLFQEQENIVLPTWLSTHPELEERITLLKEQNKQ